MQKSMKVVPSTNPPQKTLKKHFGCTPHLINRSNDRHPQHNGLENITSKVLRRSTNGTIQNNMFKLKLQSKLGQKKTKKPKQKIPLHY
jgi:hypothetical protein